MIIWFLVLILTIGEHSALGRMPEQFATHDQCYTAGTNLFVTKYDKMRSVYCIRADNENDLVAILRGAFKFKGDEI